MDMNENLAEIDFNIAC